MILKFQELINHKLSRLTDAQKNQLALDTFIILFDTREKAISVLTEMETRLKTPEGEAALSTLADLEFLESVMQHLHTNKLTGIIRGAKELNDSKDKLFKDVNVDFLKMLLEKQKIISEHFLCTLFNIKEKPLTTQSLSEAIKKDIYYTKEEIAAEFGIDKKTLNKWLMAISGNKYSGRKKLEFLEYKEIFESLFLANDEDKLDIDRNFEIYFGRLGLLSRQKSDLVEATSSDYKTLKANAEKICTFYPQMNVFPYCISEAIIEKMVGKLKISPDLR